MVVRRCQGRFKEWEIGWGEGVRRYVGVMRYD
jgi:hypothetical protein